MPNNTRTSAFWFCMPHSYAVRILVVNVNTTAAMTEAIAASAKSVAGPETEILPLTPDIGADEGSFTPPAPGADFYPHTPAEATCAEDLSCAVCGEPIAPARLEARPTTDRCIRHA